MNDKMIIELVVSQNHHDLSVFRSSVVCLCLRKANCLSLLSTIVNFLINFPSLFKPVYFLCRRLSSIGFHRVFPLYSGKSRTHFSCNKYYFNL